MKPCAVSVKDLLRHKCDHICEVRWFLYDNQICLYDNNGNDDNDKDGVDNHDDGDSGGGCYVIVVDVVMVMMTMI